MDNRVYIFDTTLRDGEQVPGCQLNTNEKIEIAKSLEELGVDIIEAGFPVSSPGDFESVIALSKAVRNPVICALSRSIPKDIDVAAEALAHAEVGRIHTGIGVSDVHIKYKFQSTREEIKTRAVNAVKYAKNRIEQVEFYAEDAGRADEVYLAEIVESVIDAGATIINVPDTSGYCLPEEYGNKIKFLRENVKNIDKAIISVHCHNDLGLATANAIAGLNQGARQVEATINGIGERAGNTSMEEVVMVLAVHKKLGLHTNIDTTKITNISHLVADLMNMPVQANKSIVGKNAFSHSSGIHQDGVIKHRENYEIINPQDVGAAGSKIVLTARSGRAALNYHLERLGFNLEKEQLSKVYDAFLKYADAHKVVSDEDLKKLVAKEYK